MISKKSSFSIKNHKVVTNFIYQVALVQDCEETYWSSREAATCPPVYHTRWRLHTVPLIAERQMGNCEHQSL